MMKKYGALVVGMVLLAVGGSALAGERYNDLEDAAVVQARIWQSGGKARPLISSDGKVVFAFGQSMPKLTCSPTRACDVEMQAGEKVKQIILGDASNWTKAEAESVERGQLVQHVVFQPRDNDLESNAIITTDRRTYHIKLYAPKNEGVYLNRVGFYYPEDLVTSWTKQDAAAETAKEKESGGQVMPLMVSIDKIDDGYKIEGSASFKPTRVFNNGERVFLEMPSSVLTGESPMVLLLDDKSEVSLVTYRREVNWELRKVIYIVDRLFDRCELRIGSEKVRVTWKKYKSGGWSW